MTTDEARALTPGLYRFTIGEDREEIARVEVSGTSPGGPYPGFYLFGSDRWYWGTGEYGAWSEVSRAAPLLTVPLTPGMSQAQQLAVAVLQGNTDAIPGLLDAADDEFHGRRPTIEEQIAEVVKKERERKGLRFDVGAVFESVVIGPWEMRDAMAEIPEIRRTDFGTVEVTIRFRSAGGVTYDSEAISDPRQDAELMTYRTG